MAETLADKIFGLNQELTTLTRKQNLLQRAMSVKEAKFKLAIHAEKDASGKNRYTNDDLRRAGFELMKESNDAYKRTRRELAAVEARWFRVLAEIERARTTRDETALTRRERLAAR